MPKLADKQHGAIRAKRGAASLRDGGAPWGERKAVKRGAADEDGDYLEHEPAGGEDPTAFLRTEAG